jgi:hypothetical protein
MTIHFIGSKSGLEDEIGHYRKIVAHIKSRGHTLARDWLEETYKIATNKKLEWVEIDWSKIDDDDSAAISKADIVIVEATKKGFFVGYKVSQAVQQKKPILILFRDNSFPNASKLSKSADIIQAEEYNSNNLEEILDKFIEENTINVKDMRFNFFIDRQIYNYLRWAAFKTGKTKAEILRELVQKEIENKKDI